MPLALLPPKTEPLVDKDKFATLNWLIFFEQLANGDAGVSWTPTFTGLTEVGAATKTGVYYSISKKLVFFRIIITPGTNTSAVNGTTYCNNFPLTMIADGVNVTVSGFTAAAAGSTSSNNRINTATRTNSTTPITLVGIAEVN